MFDRTFIIDFPRLVTQLTDTELRQTKFIAWLSGLASPFKVIHKALLANRRANLYNLSHNGQVCSLRKLLNDTFDPDLRRITIAEGNAFNRSYIYTNVEQKPKYLGSMAVRKRDDFADTGVDFRVILPTGFDLNPVIHQMRALVDYYKLASKRYKIQFDE